MEKGIRYCAREAQGFPEDQFITDKDGNVIHVVGDISNWHYALTGIPPYSNNGDDIFDPPCEAAGDPGDL